MDQSVKVIDKMPLFKRVAKMTLAQGTKEGARDILIKSRNRAPFKKGQLRADSDVQPIGSSGQRVTYYKEYARFQEFGGDSRRRVRNYTTQGTQAHFLKQSGDEVTKEMIRIYKKHGRRAKV